MMFWLAKIWVLKMQTILCSIKLQCFLMRHLNVRLRLFNYSSGEKHSEEISPCGRNNFQEHGEPFDNIMGYNGVGSTWKIGEKG